MGYGFRVFLVEEDNSIKMIPTAKFDRLWQLESNDQWLPYANKSIRYAKVVLNLTDRKPLSILHVDYGYLVFDSEGKLDQKTLDEEKRIFADIIPPTLNEGNSSNVIYSKGEFAKRRYKNRFTWKPDSKIEIEIYDLALGKETR